MHNRSDTAHGKENFKSDAQAPPDVSVLSRRSRRTLPANIFGNGAGRGLHMGEVQVRKDLALVSDGGRPKIGYNSTSTSVCRGKEADFLQFGLEFCHGV